MTTRRPASRLSSRFFVALALALFFLGCSATEPLVEIRALHREKRFEESLEPLTALVDAGSEDPEVLYLYGVALSATRRPSQALWPLRKAMETEEWIVPAALVMARGGLDSGNFEEAIEAASIVLEREPENTTALLIRATARTYTRKDSDYEAAIEDVDRLLELEPDNREALLPKATALLALERADEAGEALEEIAEVFQGPGVGDDEARFCVALATFATEKGDAEAAEEKYRACLEAHPTSPIVIRSAMEFLDGKGRPKEATEIIRAAHEAAPESRDFRVGYAYRQQVSGDLEGAEATLRSATEQDDPLMAAEAWRDLAGFHADRQKFEEAVKAYDEAVRRVSRPSAEFLFGHGDLLVLAGEYDRALEVASKLDSPSHAAMIKGRVHLAREEPEAALESFSEGLLLWPNNVVARYYAAIAAEQSGLFDRAIEEYRYALRIDPAATDGRFRLARILAAEGEDTLALGALHHNLQAAPSTVDMALLEMELISRRGPVSGAPPPRLMALVGKPDTWGRAVAGLASGAWDRAGPTAAVNIIAGTEKLDLSDPQNAPALRILVRAELELGREAELIKRLNELAAKRADQPLLHALLGKAHLAQAATEEARAAFERALELDPIQPEALAGLGSMLEAAEPEQALAYYLRGVEDEATLGEPERGELARAAAAVLNQLGREDEAIALLERRLRAEPLDARASNALARTLLDRGVEADRARAESLMARSARFADRRG